MTINKTDVFPGFLRTRNNDIITIYNNDTECYELPIVRPVMMIMNNINNEIQCNINVYNPFTSEKFGTFRAIYNKNNIDNTTIDVFYNNEMLQSKIFEYSIDESIESELESSFNNYNASNYKIYSRDLINIWRYKSNKGELLTSLYTIITSSDLKSKLTIFNLNNELSKNNYFNKQIIKDKIIDLANNMYIEDEEVNIIISEINIVSTSDAILQLRDMSNKILESGNANLNVISIEEIYSILNRMNYSIELTELIKSLPESIITDTSHIVDMEKVKEIERIVNVSHNMVPIDAVDDINWFSTINNSKINIATYIYLFHKNVNIIKNINYLDFNIYIKDDIVKILWSDKPSLYIKENKYNVSDNKLQNIYYEISAFVDKYKGE